ACQRTNTWRQAEARHVLTNFRIRRAGSHLFGRATVWKACWREGNGNRLEIPMLFLWKILRKLSEEKLVRSFKGVRGGYELARPAKNIRVSEVLAAGRDGDQMGRCVLGLDKCDDHDPCPLHSQWKSLRKQIESRFQVTTLADLVRDLKPPAARRRRALAVQKLSA